MRNSVRVPCHAALLSLIATHEDAAPSANLENILRQEAIYFSIGGHFNRLRTSINIHTLVAKFALDVQHPSPT